MPKKELLRIVRDKVGKVSVDYTGKANGRGAYLTKDLDVIKRARTTKLLNKYLDIVIPDKIYEEIDNYISNSE